MQRKLIGAIAILAAVAACSDFDEPGALDAKPIYGCYRAPGSPSFAITPAGVRIAGSGRDIPFRYEMRKVGPVLKIAASADVVAGRYVFQQSDDHFYRVIFSADEPTIRVAFGKEGYLSDYVRSQGSDCTV